MSTFSENFEKAFGQKPFTKFDPIAAKRYQIEKEQDEVEEIPEQEPGKGQSATNRANVAYWEGFTDTGAMSHYNDLMDILDKTERMETFDEVKDYIGQLKGTTMYKIIPGVKTWIDDLESLYYGRDEGEKLSYPVDVMRNQTEIAKQAYDDGYRSIDYTQPMPKAPSPRELLPKIKMSYK